MHFAGFLRFGELNPEWIESGSTRAKMEFSVRRIGHIQKSIRFVHERRIPASCRLATIVEEHGPVSSAA
jgi:hypothetical protein